MEGRLKPRPQQLSGDGGQQVGDGGNVGMKSPLPGEVRASEKPRGFVWRDGAQV